MAAMTIDAESAAKFTIYVVDANNEPLKTVAAFDDPDQVNNFNFRLDKHYKIREGQAFLTPAEFKDQHKR